MLNPDGTDGVLWSISQIRHAWLMSCLKRELLKSRGISGIDIRAHPLDELILLFLI